jgi:hypothetical protein
VASLVDIDELYQVAAMASHASVHGGRFTGHGVAAVVASLVFPEVVASRLVASWLVISK